MSEAVKYSADQKDALQELLNIAMGQAADSLARALETLVEITVPQSDIIGASDLSQTVTQLERTERNVTVARQGFYSDLQGEAIVLFGVEDSRLIADLMGYEEIDEMGEQELLLDVTNVLVGACMTGFGKQVDANIGFSPPRIMAVDVPVNTLLESEEPSWTHSLVINLNFGLAERSFLCELIFLMPESSIEKVRHAVQVFIDSL